MRECPAWSVRGRRESARQDADIVVEQREIVACLGHAADRGRELEYGNAGAPRQQLRRLLRLIGLVQDSAHTLFADLRGELGEPRRARRNTFLDLDHVDNVEPEPPREVGPGVVIGEEWGRTVRRELLLPFGDPGAQAFKKTVPVGDDFFGKRRRYPDC